MNPGLQEALMRAFERVPDDEEPAIYKCPKCRDTGVVMHAEGTFDVGGTRGSTSYRGGKEKVLMATATPENPVAGRCWRCNPKRGSDAEKKPSRSSFGDDQ